MNANIPVMTREEEARRDEYENEIRQLRLKLQALREELEQARENRSVILVDLPMIGTLCLGMFRGKYEAWAWTRSNLPTAEIVGTFEVKDYVWAMEHLSKGLYRDVSEADKATAG